MTWVIDYCCTEPLDRQRQQPAGNHDDEQQTERSPIDSAFRSRKCPHLCEADDAVILRVEDDHFCVASHYGSLSTISRGQAIPIRGDWLSGRVFKQRATINVRDVRLESFADFDNETPQIHAEYHSVVAAPMLRDGDAIGTIAVRRRAVQPFTARECELLLALAKWSVDKIEIDELGRDRRQRRAPSARPWSSRPRPARSCT